jgi:uncharacterized repeat protein (TIGR01451 family)
MNGYQYRAVFTNTEDSATTNAATLTVSAASTAPTVTTGTVTDITTTSATGNGNVTSDGGSAITERGIVWATTVDPTTSDNKVTAAGTTGAFTGAITGLAPGTPYHVRAYATNSVGTSYGDDVTFTSEAAATEQAPIIITQPQNTTVVVGEMASFTVEYTGNPAPTFQWQLRTNNDKKWRNIAGANSDTYTTPAATSEMNGCRYRVILSNYLGSVTSEAATLTVNEYTEVPVVTTQPEDQTVTEGDTASFSAAAIGNPTPAAQWQLSTDSGSSWGDIEGATSTTYTTGAATLDMSGYQYRAVFPNTAGSATTNEATLTVTAVSVAVADVSISKTGEYNPETNTVTWTIIVTNSGPDTAEGVVVTDNLSNNSRDISVTTDCNYKINGKKVIVDIGTLGIGISEEIIITEALAKQTTGEVTNTATVTTTSDDPYLTNNKDTTSITISR